MDLSQKRVTVLGAGKIGRAILGALLEQGVLNRQKTLATVQHGEKAQALTASLGIPVGTDNREAIRNADVILICVKPQVVQGVLEEIRPAISNHQLVISVAASVRIAQIEQALGSGIPVVRTMPNTPCVIGSGMTALCGGRSAAPDHMEIVSTLFGAIGRTVILDEKHMNAVTGLAASGPAFIYIILESLAEAGVKVGLPREIATLLAAQTTMGAARMVLETGDHPALLKDAVTTPAGCTIDGILELEEGGLRVTLIKAVVKAAQRARELAGDKDSN
ncbi:MAG TPA: pyrroline-5-carboxylate reductase [Candidatus Binatia bacterium]|nr:pyrroline-5-carboxylate reductase [Candidatus Binatia bacterium]